MPRVASAAPKKRAGPKNVKLAERFPKDTILKDILKKQWRLGDVIGQGGFGLVYLANPSDIPAATSLNAQNVMKIEPGANGPLFCEMNFYIRAAKSEFIEQFKKSHKLKYLSVPPYIGSGLHTYNSSSYRFLVMPRYGTDLQKLLHAAGGKFPSATVFAIGLRMVDALHYLHEREYVHADVKASNILLGFDGHSENKDQVYLADYGLACRYTANCEHKEYKVDPRSAHNGTIEFTSRDAHKGVFPSRRGDMEILGFCMLQWLCGSGKLPWETNLANPNLVARKKEEAMDDVGSLIKTCLPGSSTSSDCIKQYLQEVCKLEYDEAPNYRKFKDLLKSGLTKAGQKDEWKIDFPTGLKQTPKRKSTGAASPCVVSPKKPKLADKAVSKASPAPSKASSVKKKTAAQKKSPVVNGRKHTVVSPAVPRVPLAIPPPTSALSASAVNGKTSPRKAPTVRKRFEAAKSPKSLQIPPASKPSPATPRQSAAAVASKVRRVRKTNVSRSDASIQTTPGLKQNS